MKSALAALAASMSLGVGVAAIDTALVAVQQARATGAAAISGVVRDAHSGQPLQDAIVSLVGSPTNGAAHPAAQFTDERGRFVFPDLPGGRSYFLRITKPGYMDGTIGTLPYRVRMPIAIDLADGEWIDDADVALQRLGGVSGTVTDDRGDPVSGAAVRVLSVARVGGRERLAGGASAVTDDRGAYRVGGLAPGRFVAIASLARYPLATSTSLSDLSTTPELESGEELVGLDVRFGSMSAHAISGVVDGPPELLARLALRLIPEGLEEASVSVGASMTPVAVDGSFRFTGVPDGTYTIDVPSPIARVLMNAASPGVPAGDLTRLEFGDLSVRGPGAPLWTRVRVTVNGADVGGLVLPMRSAASLAVRVQSEPDPAAVSAVRDRPVVILEPVGGEQSLGRPRSDEPRSPDGPAEISGILPGRYVFRSGSPTWLIKSVIAGGRDITHAVVDATAGLPFTSVAVTMTTSAATLTGSVRSDTNARDAAAVIAFPVERDQWADYGQSPRIAAALAGRRGGFRVPMLTAGSYYIVAVPAERVDAWQDPEFLARAAAVATQVRLDWGETLTVHLRVFDVR